MKPGSSSGAASHGQNPTESADSSAKGSCLYSPLQVCAKNSLCVLVVLDKDEELNPCGSDPPHKLTGG